MSSRRIAFFMRAGTREGNAEAIVPKRTVVKRVTDETCR